MSTTTTPVDSLLQTYLLEDTVRESTTLTALRKHTSTLAMGRMQIRPEQGQLMALLLKLSQARRVLEIGTFTGYSALWMAEALPKKGKLVACDVSEEWTAIAKHYWQQAGVAHKIELRIGPALTTLEDLIQQKVSEFDFAFIDADKINNENYFECCMKLVRKNGIIAIDNVFRGGKVCQADRTSKAIVAQRALTKKLQRDGRIDLSVVPIGDGLLLARIK